MFKLIVYLLAAYAVYALFLKDKVFTIGPKPKDKNSGKYSDYEEVE